MTQTIIVADDHPLFRTALKQAVNQAVPDAETVEVDSRGSTNSIRGIARRVGGGLSLSLSLAS